MSEVNPFKAPITNHQRRALLKLIAFMWDSGQDNDPLTDAELSYGLELCAAAGAPPEVLTNTRLLFNALIAALSTADVYVQYLLKGKPEGFEKWMEEGLGNGIKSDSDGPAIADLEVIVHRGVWLGINITTQSEDDLEVPVDPSISLFDGGDNWLNEITEG